MASTDNKKNKTNANNTVNRSKVTNTNKTTNSNKATSANKVSSNTKKMPVVSKQVAGKIDTKKVFPKKKDQIEVEEISIQEALTSRVKRNSKLYTSQPNSEEKEKKAKENLFVTKQQKFNFEKNSLEDENEDEKKNKKTTVLKEKEEKKPISVKVEEIPMKKALKKKHGDDRLVVTMLFLAVVIVFLGVFLIYHFGTYDHDKVKEVIKTKNVEVVPENIVFLGDSITDFYDLDKYYPDYNVVNSGIGGNKTTDILDDMKGRVYQYNPSKVFLMIGTNDIEMGRDVNVIVTNIKDIIKKIKENRSKATIYLESLYPINSEIEDSFAGNRDNEKIKKINKQLKKYCEKQKITFIDMFSQLVDEDGNLDVDYTEEGLHLNDKGYEKVTFVLKKYIEE